MKSRRFAAAVLCAGTLFAAGASRAESVAEVRQALSKVLPHFPASAQVIKTPYAGLYEVDVGDHVFYTDAKGSFLFAGEILDTHSGQNVTKARVEQLQKVDWKTLPLQDTFKVVYGNGSREVAVFEDPYCPYCHQLDKALEQVGNVTVHVFLFPVIRPESPAKAKDIWCAADRAKAWQAWMNSEKQPPKAAAGCNAEALNANLALGQRLGIQSTPTLFLRDGTRITGAVDAAELNKRLAAR